MFLFGDIPEKKLNNATKNYAPIKGGEEVVLLYEYSAKEGFVLTTNSLYVNQPTYSGCSVGASAAVSDISSISHRKKGGLSPEEYIDIQAGSKTLTIQYMYGKQLMGALEKTISVLKSAGPSESSGAASQPVMQETTPIPEKKEGEDIADKMMDAADKAKNALGKLGGLFGKK
ncbi:MAG: hypothetical protein FWD36_10650 [Treponema sp.]|nr:hypothetical protein [Treponema sp.]